MGAPLSVNETRMIEAEEHEAAQAVQKPAPPPVPYRANTTGLSTTGLPKPPVRRLEDGTQSATASPTTKPKPSLPPRLPPRQNSHPTANAPSPPPDYKSATQQPPAQDQFLNQGALGRLGKAGVSVPGLGIGAGRAGQGSSQAVNPWRRDSNTATPSTSSPTTTTATTQSPSITSIQSRFGAMTTTSPTTPSSPSSFHSPSDQPPPAQGTTFAQKQAALRTASQLRTDPSSISLADARSSAATATNFRDRHGDQLATGWKSANALNKKYDVANRVNAGAGGSGIAVAGQNYNVGNSGNNASSAVMRGEEGNSNNNIASPAPPAAAAAAGGETMPPASPSPWANERSQSAFRKAPPPPPVKRTGTTSGPPPPVPMGSKPRS